MESIKENFQLKLQNYCSLKEQNKLAYCVKREKRDFNSLD